jgi:aminoglycoside phosphotransferase (APT) family kinase protein
MDVRALEAAVTHGDGAAALATDADPLFDWHADQFTGWQFVLPALRGKTVLCLCEDSSVATVLARMGAQVLLLVDRARGLPAEPALALTGHESAVRRVSLNDWCARPERIDGVVMHDLRGAVGSRVSRQQGEALMSMAVEQLAPDGFVYLGVENRWSFDALRGLARGRWPVGRSLWTRTAARRLLQRLGLQQVSEHPMLTDDGRVTELIGPAGYLTNAGHGGVARHVKQWIYGRVGRRHWAPAYALVACRRAEAAQASVLDQVAERVQQIYGWAERPTLQQHLCLRIGKVIASFAVRGSDREAAVAVLASSPLSAARRVAEARTLERLAQLPQRLARLIPNVSAVFPIAGATCVVMNRFAGVTIDAQHPRMNDLTHVAVDFLIELHCEASRVVTVDESVFERHVQSLIDAACDRNPKLATMLRAWEPALRRRLLGRQLPLVWLHGDYKIENLMFDPRDWGLAGVIDWEHAVSPGLPLLDLQYLLVYNRCIAGASWTDAIDRLIVRGEATDAERACLQRYTQAMAIDDSVARALGALFLAHHIGVRLHLDGRDEVRHDVANLIRGMQTTVQA